jgi:hypothetical protein
MNKDTQSEITFEGGVKAIGDMTFDNCRLTCVKMDVEGNWIMNLAKTAGLNKFTLIQLHQRSLSLRFLGRLLPVCHPDNSLDIKIRGASPFPKPMILRFLLCGILFKVKV